jgi:hypothetical protein
MSTSAAADLADEYGIETDNERMPNGELRFRMYGKDGNGYVRVISGPSGAWQNSHYHHRIRETYIVETGWMVLAECRSDAREFMLKRLDAGGIVTTQPLLKHNVYLPAGALIHVVKHGSVPGEADWIAAPDLDAVTKGLSERQVLEQAMLDS